MVPAGDRSSLGRAPSTVSREVAANGGRGLSSARGPCGLVAATRPRRASWLNPVLRDIVAEKLQRRWSPQQIAGWLKLTYPDDPEMQVSHESIYRTLFVQSRGALRRELTAYLRTGRVIRTPRASGCPTAAAGARTSCTSPSDQRRPKTAQCPGTGKATWSSARR